ncbi:sulfatase [Halobellus limi]|uniref:Arylsulfatase n=1 Tax=Halobellus limi TaxID=699433 RepID=A0A1H5TWW7_9EURY|nr:sulfatase [Halobellus limi]QCC47214.1 arylsulfatase [Halobellus limi]SEF67324.1 arylsulfatase [Halobellus limi]
MNDVERPNIVLVTVDSLRADHCGCYGYERNTTPTLDTMAREGTKFEHAIAPGPATPESMPVIFTGDWPVDRDVDGDSELVRRRERIRAHMEARYTLPERMRELGYETAAFTPNPFTSRHFGFDQGFDHFQDFMDESNRGSLYETVFQGFLEGSGASSLARAFVNFWQREEVFKPWESYYEEVLEWTRNATEPYFLWVFLMDAHNPYLSSAEYRTQSRLREFRANVEFWRQSHETPFSDTVHGELVTAYDDSVRYSDAFLERLRSDLREDDPVIAVHGDHGEAFGEHDVYGHEPYLYEENVRVPLVVDGPPAGEISEPFSLRELPDVLSSIAAGDTTIGPTRPAVARTRDGDALSVRIPGETHRLALSEGEGDSTLPEAIDTVVARYRAGERERRSIASAASALATDETL